MLSVFLVVAVDLIGFGMVLPLLPFFASEFHASPFTIGLIFGVYSFAQFIFAPLWGGLSDRIGRRPVMLISTFGASIAYVIFAFATSIEVLFLSRILAGVMAGNIAAAQAYMTDITSEEDRSRGMGIIGAAFAIGFSLGPLISSFLVEGENFMRPALCAAALSGISFLMVLFKLKEPKRHVGIVRSRNLGAALANPLFLCALVLALAHSSLYSAFPLFASEVRTMSAADVGRLYGLMGVISIVIQGVAMKRLTAVFGDRTLFVTGTLLMTAGLASAPFLPLYVALSIATLGSSLNGPTLLSMISKSEGAAGATMGTAQGMSALGRMVGPVWGGWLYTFSASLPFIVTGIVTCSSLALASRVLRSRGR